MTSFPPEVSRFVKAIKVQLTRQRDSTLAFCEPERWSWLEAKWKGTAVAEKGEKRRADKSPATLLCEHGGGISGQRQPCLHKLVEGNQFPTSSSGEASLAKTP